MAEEIKKQLYEELEKAANDLPPDLKRKVLDNLRQWKIKIDKSLSILLTGKTGSGKSTLINGILGVAKDDNTAAKEGNSITAPGTTEVEQYQKDKNGVNVAVWDSPGLQDGTQCQDRYIQQMKKNCSNVDLVLYCTKMSETRFVRGSDNPDIEAMRELTKAFGFEFWQKAVVVLTYANTLEAFNPDWQDLSDEEKGKAFNAKIKEWEGQIKLILSQDIGISNEIVKDLKIVPAGHVRFPHLPGIQYWLSNLWFQCLFTITSPEPRCALLQINLTRFKKTSDVEKEDFKKKAEEQPLVISPSWVNNIILSRPPGRPPVDVTPGRDNPLRASAAAVGGVIGGMFGGPIGAILGVAFGALMA